LKIQLTKDPINQLRKITQVEEKRAVEILRVFMEKFFIENNSIFKNGKSPE
jgi:hypothetical protein